MEDKKLKLNSTMKDMKMFNSEWNCPDNQVFVPVSDELIFDSPELIEGPLVPYSSGMACHGWLSIELNPADEAPLNMAKTAKQVNHKGLLHKVGLRGRSAKDKTSTLETARHLKLVFGG